MTAKFTILLNILTPGDELVRVRVANEIRKKYPDLLGNGLDIQIANEEAYKAGKRFIDEDLNRCFPGNPNGTSEQKRAAAILPNLTTYDCVIDIHSTKSTTTDTIIITKITPTIRTMISVIEPRHVFMMKVNPDGALIHHCTNGIALEFGNDASEEVFQKNVRAIDTVISTLLLQKPTPGLGMATDYYEVFAPIQKNPGDTLLPEIKNFSLVTAGMPFATNKVGKPISYEEDFYPVIFGQSNYETIFGFAAKKIDLTRQVL